MYQRQAYVSLRRRALEEHSDVVGGAEALPNQIVFDKLRLLFKRDFYLDVHMDDDLKNYSFHAQFEDGLYRWDRDPYHGKHEHMWSEESRKSLKKGEGIDDSTASIALNEVIGLLRKWMREKRIP